jgi:uncharacterized protein (UPF0264 family)
MRLLVSVRTADEAATAVSGGADLVDAKEPSRGALAPVAPAVLLGIAAAVPPEVPLSVALGEGPPADLADAVRRVPALGPRRALYFKFAVRGTTPHEAMGRVADAVALLDRRPDAPRLVLARYADEGLGDADQWIRLAANAGVRGLLLDTRNKHGGSLLDVVSVADLEAVRSQAARLGVWLALAGSLSLTDLEAIGRVRPHLVGVRGAVCEGGRAGALASSKVRALRQELNRIALSRGIPTGRA